jgi:hypothetical protein
VRAVAAPLPGLGLPALSRPAPVVAFFSRMTQVALPLLRGNGRLAEWWTRTAGPVAPCPVLGCVVAVAGIAEVPWEVPWRPLLLGGNLFEECHGDPQGWAGHVFGMADAQGCQLVFPSLRGG